MMSNHAGGLKGVSWMTVINLSGQGRANHARHNVRQVVSTLPGSRALTGHAGARSLLMCLGLILTAWMTLET